ncbi:scoloptoxin SSD14-like isoform X2 [Uloborus diversus]|uniref:scoloptoxin SSD14-like isoform X2 n=1 Tax=Uloborus diversus TaxID=327109 RepID=UPI00240A224F|nr:scoloptoxin SSD14-like isoform X2 [Uloborus diversus]
MVSQEGTRLIGQRDSGPDSYYYGTIKYEPLHSQTSRCLCTKRDTIIVMVVLLGAFILVTTSLALGLPKINEKRLQYLDTSFPVSASPISYFDKAVVVSDGGPCAKIGKDILQEGGSAVDAAIAALICDGVVNPQSMGIGGGFLMTVYIRESNTSFVVDARETAPKTASQNMFDSNSTLSQFGGLSIAIPGEVKGYWVAHQKFGKLPWKTLFQPSVKLCNEGFKVSRHLASKLQKLRERILADNSMRLEFFNNETQDILKEGEVLKRPVLGTTLNKIAEKGADILYTGELKDQLVEDISKCGGIITAEDLTNYKAVIKPSAKVQLNGPVKLMLHTVPTPGSGLILSFILNVLSHYNMTADNFTNTDDAALMYHRIIEAFKFGFAHRSHLGDDAFVNVTEVLSNLQSKTYTENIWKQISDMETFPVNHYKPLQVISDDHGTAHVSVIAENGDAVSVTSTVNTYFGSLCRSSSTGIIFNNGMDDFSSPNITNYFDVPPSPANYIEPGKRPLSSMCPTIAVNNEGDVHMVIGSAGGTRMITASALSIIRNLWLSEDIKKATDAPRIHHQLLPNHLQFEDTFPKIYLDKLEDFGHITTKENQGSIFLGIVKENGKWQTNVDFRKGGSAEGY